jgi:lipoyl(octanoyl) transferase
VTIEVRRLGTIDYQAALDLQAQLVERRKQGLIPDQLLLLEHPPVITLGVRTRNDRSHVLESEASLAAKGIALFESGRGGDVTYHGPGQLVVYPIRKLERFREVVPLVRALEGAVLDTCAAFGIEAARWSEHAGVWVGENQICAIGLAVQRMVSLHGIALNVSTELDYDRLIVPCGLPERGITSISKETGRQVTLEEAKAVLLKELSKTFGVTFTPPIEEAIEA